MNNFLIVDNERIICDGMRQALKKAGLFNVFVAYDGIQALSIIKEKNIKAMILDIAMPDMNGVELMKELSRLGLKPVTVIVSGYDEFEYAKEALSYGAIDYILKPLDTDDVIEIGKKMLKLIEQQEIQKQETDKLRKFVLENMESIKQKVLYDVLNGGVSSQRLQDISDFYGLNLDGDYFCVAVIYADKSRPDMNELEFQIKLKMVEDRITKCICNDDRIHLFSMENAKYVLLFNAKEPFEEGYIQNELDGMTTELNNITEVYCYLGKGDEVNKNSIVQSYRNAQEALDYKSMFGAGFVYNIKDYRQNSHVLALEQLLRELESYLRLMQYDSARQKVKEFFEYMRDNRLNISGTQVHFFSIKCAVLFSTLLLENGHDAAGATYDNILNMVKLFTGDSLQTAEKQVVKMFDRTIEQISSGYMIKHKKIAALIKQHIDADYANNELSVAVLSSVFNYSPNYLGNVFKKEYGVAISDYINKYRIEKAKKLMDETNLKIYEIAFEVGFKDQHYFSKQFKKYENVTPKEYKDK